MITKINARYLKFEGDVDDLETVSVYMVTEPKIGGTEESENPGPSSEPDSSSSTDPDSGTSSYDPGDISSEPGNLPSQKEAQARSSRNQAPHRITSHYWRFVALYGDWADSSFGNDWSCLPGGPQKAEKLRKADEQKVEIWNSKMRQSRFRPLFLC